MDRKLQKQLGQVARAARERLGLTQSQVAERVHLVLGAYGRVERGGMMPSVPTLRRMCVELGISADTLLSLSSRQVASSVQQPAPLEDLSPTLRRLVHQLRAWPEHRLAWLERVVKVLATGFEL